MKRNEAEKISIYYELMDVVFYYELTSNKSHGLTNDRKDPVM